MVINLLPGHERAVKTDRVHLGKISGSVSVYHHFEGKVVIVHALGGEGVVPPHASALAKPNSGIGSQQEGDTARGSKRLGNTQIISRAVIGRQPQTFLGFVAESACTALVPVITLL